jgi:hypothetical protein
MRPHKPVITTKPNGEVIEFTASYESPAWANLILSLRHFGFVLLTILLFAAGGYYLFTTPLGLTLGQTIVVAVAWLPGAWVTARVVTNVLADVRFGLLPGGDRLVHLTLGRESAQVWSGTASGIYPRGPALRFTAQPHLNGKHETRHAENTGQHGPHLFRDSFQIWLQHGERLIELAATASEDEANAIVRQLQAADEQAARGHADAEVFARRYEPE